MVEAILKASNRGKWKISWAERDKGREVKSNSNKWEYGIKNWPWGSELKLYIEMG